MVSAWWAVVAVVVGNMVGMLVVAAWYSRRPRR
jgi:hypothetical protein